MWGSGVTPDPRDVGPPPQTPLLVAAAAAASGVVGDLLALGADPDAADHRGRTALHLAATYGLPKVLQVGHPKNWGGEGTPMTGGALKSWGGAPKNQGGTSKAS